MKTGGLEIVKIIEIFIPDRIRELLTFLLDHKFQNLDLSEIILKELVLKDLTF